MQVACVTDMEKMNMEEVTKRILDTILLDLRVKLIELPIYDK